MLVRSLLMKAAQAIPAWTPANITTALWLDAADNATVFSDAGTTQAIAGTSAVQQWNDKSGNTRHAIQLASAKQPNYTGNVANGKPGITFNGSANGHVLASPLPSSVFTTANRCTFAAVYSPLGSASYQGIASIGDTQYSAIPWMLIQQDTGTSQRVYVNADYKVTNTIAANSFYVLLFGYTGTQWIFRLNGTANASYTGSIVTTQTGSTLWIGSGYLTEWNGRFCEIVALPSSLSSLDTQKLEGYLAHKWGLAANLPNDHSYKNFAPTI